MSTTLDLDLDTTLPTWRATPARDLAWRLGLGAAMLTVTAIFEHRHVSSISVWEGDVVSTITTFGLDPVDLTVAAAAAVVVLYGALPLFGAIRWGTARGPRGVALVLAALALVAWTVHAVLGALPHEVYTVG